MFTFPCSPTCRAPRPGAAFDSLGMAPRTSSAAERPARRPMQTQATPPSSPPACPPAPAPRRRAAPRPPGAPSPSFAVNLLNRLVQRGILTQQDADDLTRQAESDAASARAQSQADAGAAAQAVAAQVAQRQADMTPPPAHGRRRPRALRPPGREGPDARRDQAGRPRPGQGRELGRARTPSPNGSRASASPAISASATRGLSSPIPTTTPAPSPTSTPSTPARPFDVAGTNFSPQYNVDQNRKRFRLRARIGAEVDLQDGFTAGIRLATGENDSPVTENQTLGLANKRPGRQLQQIRHLAGSRLPEVRSRRPSGEGFLRSPSAALDNPFFGTTHDLGERPWLRWHRGRRAATRSSAASFPSSPPAPSPSSIPTSTSPPTSPRNSRASDKYLFGGQLGTTWTINKDFNAKLAGAYYYFYNIEGQLSSPFTPLSASDQGNTDNSRPSFAQNGNTYFPIRDIVPTAQNNFGTIDQFQYYGLATPFHELAFTGQLNYDHFAPFRVSLDRRVREKPRLQRQQDQRPRRQ